MFIRLLLTSLLLISIHAQAGICTREYAPVCGQLPQHTQTFSNLCMLKDAGAAWLSDGECPSNQVNANAKNITLTVAGHDAACVAAARRIATTSSVSFEFAVGFVAVFEVVPLQHRRMGA